MSSIIRPPSFEPVSSASPRRPVIFVDVDGVLAPVGQRVRVGELNVNKSAVRVLDYIRKQTDAGIVLATSRIWGVEEPSEVKRWLFDLLPSARLERDDVGHIGTVNRQLARHNMKETAIAEWLRAHLALRGLPRRWLIIDDEIGHRLPSELRHDARAHIITPDPRKTLGATREYEIERAIRHLLAVPDEEA